MATLSALSYRLRSEIGDTSRSFAENFTGNSVTSRFQLSEAPVNAATLVVKVAGVDVSSDISVEEVTGLIQFDTPPGDGNLILVSGTTYKYFTDTEICYYVNTAFAEHAKSGTDANGSLVNMTTLPVVEEYPVVVLASTMALYTLATDAAFDIDIISPDGVSIPRSERYRQLSEMIQTRKEQYRELCSMLGVGLYKIEVFNLRRISRMTNRYVPMYRPQEVDDGSIPQRISLPMPTYGDVTAPTPALSKDLNLYAGDDFREILRFSMDLTTYTPLSQVRLYPSIPGSQVGPVILATFTITKTASQVGGILNQLVLTLPSSVTAHLPNVSYYDIQLTAQDGTVKTYMFGKIFAHYQVSEAQGQQ